MLENNERWSSSDSVKGVEGSSAIARRASSRTVSKSSWFESVCPSEGGRANSRSFASSTFSTIASQNEARRDREKDGITLELIFSGEDVGYAVDTRTLVQRSGGPLRRLLP